MDINNESKSTKGTQTDSKKFLGSYYSGIRDYIGRIDFDYRPAPAHAIKFGVSTIVHRFNPGATQVIQTTTGTPTPPTESTENRKIYTQEYALYAEDDFEISNALKINAGVHIGFANTKTKGFLSLQPRFAARYKVGKVALKASFATMSQNLHLLTNSGIGLPTDLWLPATEKVKPENSWQAATGAAYELKEKGLEFSLEGYYKRVTNVIEYLPGANFLSTSGTDWEDKVAIGNGDAYGAELFVQKKAGKTTGWIGYTLSWSNRDFKDLNEGKPFPFKYDRRHDASLVVQHKFNRTIDLSGAWVYGTGNAITIPVGVSTTPSRNPFGQPSELVIDYSERNAFRMSANHRLDLALNIHRKRHSRFFGDKIRTWTFSVYNAYNNKNPFYLIFM